MLPKLLQLKVVPPLALQLVAQDLVVLLEHLLEPPQTSGPQAVQTVLPEVVHQVVMVLAVEEEMASPEAEVEMMTAVANATTVTSM